jgi:hypothetical protein
MSKPTQNVTKTWINIVFNDKTFSKGHFTLNYSSDKIDEIWSKCLTMPKYLTTLLYSVQVSTKINKLTNTSGNYVLVFYCDSRLANQVVVKVTEYLDYSNVEGCCAFTVSRISSKNDSKTIFVPIKQLVVLTLNNCFDSDEE